LKSAMQCGDRLRILTRSVASEHQNISSGSEQPGAGCDVWQVILRKDHVGDDGAANRAVARVGEVIDPQVAFQAFAHSAEVVRGGRFMRLAVEVMDDSTAKILGVIGLHPALENLRCRRECERAGRHSEQTRKHRVAFCSSRRSN
jgi:hypothetical protein